MSLKQCLSEVTKKNLYKSQVTYHPHTPWRKARTENLIKYLEETLNMKFSRMYNLGKGGYGDVYKVNNKAIKIGHKLPSFNNDINIDKLIEDNPRGFVKVYNYIQVPDNIIGKDNIIIVVMEVIENGEISVQEYQYLMNKDITYTDEVYFNSYNHLPVERFYEAFFDSFTQKMPLHDWVDIFKPIMEEEGKKDNTTFYMDMWYAGYWLLKNKLSHPDFHRGNVLHDKKNNEYKIIDVA